MPHLREAGVQCMVYSREKFLLVKDFLAANVFQFQTSSIKTFMKKLPVFIVGLGRRSGTNYLYELLTLHPDCVKSKHDGEDFIMIGADKLEGYYQKVFSYWSPNWHNSRERFRQCIEDGIVNYLDPGERGKFVVCVDPFL